MTTSDPTRSPTTLYVWIWLPGATEPVVAGVLTETAATLAGERVVTFTYAASYRSRPNAISLFPDDLPLRSGTFNPVEPSSPVRSPLALHSCVRDAAPDAWGRRVLNAKLAGLTDVDLTELTYLAHSSSDRIGALDFQLSPTHYVPRGEPATLDQLLAAAELIEAGKVLPDELTAAAAHGTSIGGARPKALLNDGGRALIAKFSSSTDHRPVVKAEAAAMILAAKAGLDVAPVQITQAAGKDVLLVTRFDRTDGTRRAMVSALTLLGAAEHESRYFTYAHLGDAVRTGPWKTPGATLRELYGRMVFNVCVGNNDDHLRNHAAFWDGVTLTLTPAYDISPQPRSTGVSTQAIGITRDRRSHSQLWLCRKAATEFALDLSEADAIITRTVDTIRNHWDDACDEAQLTATERQLLWRREILNDYIFYDTP